MTDLASRAALDLSLTPEQALVQRTAREFATNELLPKAAEIDREARFPAEAVRKLGELGFMGMMVPSEYGGAGLDAISYAVALEEINRADASVGVIMSVQNSLVCGALLTDGSEEQKRRFLPRLASGELLGCFALSEPQAGSDASNLKCAAVRQGDHWIINGTKNFITSGAHAGVVLLFAQSDPNARHRGITCLLVDPTRPEVIVAKQEHKLGIRGSDTTQLVFQEARVPDADRLGAVGAGFKIAMKTLDSGRIGIAAQAVGIARACLEDAAAYARQREAFGKPIGEFQAIQWKIADMSTELDAARLLTWRAAALKDAHVRYTAEASMAKLFASDVAVRAARECVQVFGGYGYVQDFPAERHYRDAKITEIYEGTSEIQRLVIAEDTLEE
ncbi:MAG: acyl-CoA dehydrogenase [Chloroflexi bacterium 13_1_40CM_4_68_4]|nr:MAG: acyl-CoA dehydrogenase [Chloroflexi bacterium 13_1_40CM_4_68_4]